MEHECIIGLYYDVDTDRLITQRGLKNLTERASEYRNLARLDSVYAEIYLPKRYSLSDYFDKRKSVNMKRFEYCPMCGKKIDWKEMRKENARPEED